MREHLVLLIALLFQTFNLAVADPSAACPDKNQAEVTFISDDRDCSIFYQCHWGEAYKYDCPVGLHFDSIIHVCNYPELVNCGGSVNNGNDSTEDINVNVDESSENNSNVNNEDKTEDDNAVGECPEEDGEYVTLLPHLSDCSKFFICNRGTPVLSECQDNLLFNPVLLVCDYPENAGCGENSSNGDNESGEGSMDDGSGGDQSNATNEHTENNAADGNAVGECPQVDGEYVTLLPHSSDCSKFFICNEGTPVVAECPSNLLFNANLLVCDYPENAGCRENSSNGDNETGDSSMVDEGVEDQSNGSNGSNNAENNTADGNGDNETGDGNVIDGSEEDQINEINGSNDSENNSGDENALGQCPEIDGEYVTLLPHSSDCSKFLICNEGTPVLAECPGNLLFNPNLLVCDYPENAGCGENSSNGDNGTGDGSADDESEGDQSNETNDDTENNAADGNAVGECPEVDGEYATLLPHSSDCSKFFICNEGTPVVAECPGLLLFNANLLVCDYPENAGCGEMSSNGDNETADGSVVDGGVEDQSNGSNGSNNAENNTADTNGDNETGDGNVIDGSEEDQINEINGSNDSENNSGDENALGQCPEIDGEYVTLLPHSSDCSKFFICNEGTPVLAECPGNLLFNPNLLVCDYPENAGCGENSSNGDNETGDGSADDGSEGDQSNETNEDTENNAADVNAVSECPEVDGEYVTLLPHSSDCRKFFICNEGTPVAAECPGNLLFNPNLLVCDYAENASCEN